jgi:hypothetical protein
MLCLLLLKNLVMVFTGVLVCDVAGTTGKALKPGACLGFYLVWLLMHFWWFFQFTHDCWIVLLFVACVLFLAIRVNAANEVRPRMAMKWGAVGGLAMLTSPALGLAWLVTSCVSLLHKGRRGRLLILSFAVVAAATSSWMVRNYATMGSVYLIKSNLFFDFYQANFLNRTGVLDASSFENHPMARTLGRSGGGRPDESQFVKMGESRYVHQFKKKSFERLSEDPDVYLRKLINRLLATTVYYHPYHREHEHGWTLLLRRCVYPLPFVSLLLLLYLRAFRGHPLGDHGRGAVLIYAVFLLPYVVVTFYSRYSIPLAPMQVLFCYWAADRLVDHRRSTARSR